MKHAIEALKDALAFQQRRYELNADKKDIYAKAAKDANKNIREITEELTELEAMAQPRLHEIEPSPEDEDGE